MPEVVLTILGAVLVYLFGRWQGEHQLLYQRRAEVMGELFNRFEDVDQKFYSLFHWYDAGGEPDKPEKAKLAARSFNDLQGYYRRNSIWLPLRVSNQFNNFLARYRDPFKAFTSAVISQDHQPGRVEKWNEVWTAFERESPEVRQTLETEFRAALGSYRAKLAILLEYRPASRQDQESTASERHSPGLR
jgi:hypothetical protein